MHFILYWEGKMVKVKLKPTESWCLFCGHDFMQTRSWQKFCSKGCRESYWRRGREEMKRLCEELDSLRFEGRGRGNNARMHSEELMEQPQWED